MEFQKITILLAIGGLISTVWTSVEIIGNGYAQVPPIQSQFIQKQDSINNDSSTPFSLPSIRLDNPGDLAVAKNGPIAVAGPDQIVKEGSTVILNGSGSRDPNGVILSYSWRQIPTSHFITLSGADTPVWSFNAPRVSADTTLTFELTVTDSNGSTDKNTVNVLVKHIFSTSNQSANQLANENTANFNANTTTLSTANQQIGDTAPTDNPPIAGIIPNKHLRQLLTN